MSMHQLGWRGWVLLLLLLGWGGLPLPTAHAYVYFQNETLASLPALFGRYMVDGLLYRARLQYFPDYADLCAPLDDNEIEELREQFVVPPPQTVPTSIGTMELGRDPVVILANRGRCSFQEKAEVAAALHESVQFLLVVNQYNGVGDTTGSDDLVRMYSEAYSRLVILSISHESGRRLKQWLSVQPVDVTRLGGPAVQLDSQVPPGYDNGSGEDLQGMVLGAMGLFFMMLSVTGCIIAVAATYSRISGGESVLGLERHLLTAAEVQALTDATTTDEGPNDRHSGDHDDDNVCSVCIDQLDGSITALPCHHRFHTDCIRPWLTERSCLCPLCKFDVLHHIKNNDHPDQSTHHASLLDRLLRIRWTLVHLEDHIIIVSDDEEGESDEEEGELELTQQARTP